MDGESIGLQDYLQIGFNKTASISFLKTYISRMFAVINDNIMSNSQADIMPYVIL